MQSGGSSRCDVVCIQASSTQLCVEFLSVSTSVHLLLFLATTASLVLSVPRKQYDPFGKGWPRRSVVIRCSPWSSQMALALSSMSLSLAHSPRDPPTRPKVVQGLFPSSRVRVRSHRGRCPDPTPRQPRGSRVSERNRCGKQSPTQVWVKFLDIHVKVFRP